MIPFDVQLIGGFALHSGKIAEMATGEGKTLVATLPVYLNALTGRGVHVVTVNDYLAARDSEWMGAVYKFLGLTVGCILHDQPPQRPPRAIQLRHHLRHQRRVRLRLPARQRHGLPQGGAGPARPLLRHRRRSGLDPDRRSPHAAHHQRPRRHHLRRAIRASSSRRSNPSSTPRNGSATASSPRPRRCCKKLQPDDGSNPDNREALEREIGLLLFRVKIGQPKSEGLLKLLEDPENLRLMNQAELQLHADQKKIELYAEKEELFFAIDEKSHDADLTEKGRNYPQPEGSRTPSCCPT